ncbi:MAG: hypothetical protein GBAus27B_000516 [Mycoplasmataceae bacterium]|nr:MAG: hypothetical protein GBAus27B_000516 [Mycoplasmataceae bacterium]
MIQQLKEAVATAWDLLFAVGTTTGTGDNSVTTQSGVVVKFLGFLQANPVLLLPFGFYLIFMGISTVKKLITGL